MSQEEPPDSLTSVFYQIIPVTDAEGKITDRKIIPIEKSDKLYLDVQTALNGILPQDSQLEIMVRIFDLSRTGFSLINVFPKNEDALSYHVLPHNQSIELGFQLNGEQRYLHKPAGFVIILHRTRTDYAKWYARAGSDTLSVPQSRPTKPALYQNSKRKKITLKAF